MKDNFKSSFVINNRVFGIINNIDLMKHDILIPNEQRIKDNDKINEIVQYQEQYHKTHNYFNFLGSINIHKHNNRYYLVDGQHRFNALKKLNAKGYTKIDVIIELIRVDSIEDLKSNYKVINKNTPLPEFPDTIDKNIPENVAQYFFDSYPNIWSNSNTMRVRRPHLNKNNFQESLGILTEKLNIDSVHELKTLVEDYNTKLSKWDFNNFPKFNTFKDPEKIQSKCIKTKLYLGLFTHKSNGYGYDWVKHIIREQTGKEIKEPKKRHYRKKIPKNIKDECWYKYIGKHIGAVKCICCNITEITQTKFEAGHIIPYSKGGPNTIDNLLPICGGCNRSMSDKNMNNYISEYHPNNMCNYNKQIYQILC